MRLNQVTVPALDLPASIAFYQRLGLRLIVCSAHYARLECPDGGSTFSLHRADRVTPDAGTVVYFECDDLDSQVDRLVAAGCVFEQGPTEQPWRWREARLRDPSGHAVCLYSAGDDRRFPPWRLDRGDRPMDTDRTFATERTLPFPPAAVYDAFASAAVLASWWGPAGFTNTFDTFDFRVGGRWVFTMHGPDGTAYPNTSVFAVLEPARRLVVRHDCAPHFTLTVRLVAVEGGTRLTWEQVFDDVATARAVESVVVPANEQNLDRLTRALAREAGGA